MLHENVSAKHDVHQSVDFGTPKVAFNELSPVPTFLMMDDGRVLAVQKWEPCSDCKTFNGQIIQVKVEGYIFKPKEGGVI